MKVNFGNFWKHTSVEPINALTDMDQKLQNYNFDFTGS